LINTIIYNLNPISIPSSQGTQGTIAVPVVVINAPTPPAAIFMTGAPISVLISSEKGLDRRCADNCPKTRRISYLSTSTAHQEVIEKSNKRMVRFISETAIDKTEYPEKTFKIA
jgi:hypothetical protein